jgi:hypothetical protein
MYLESAWSRRLWIEARSASEVAADEPSAEASRDAADSGRVLDNTTEAAAAAAAVGRIALAGA